MAKAKVVHSADACTIIFKGNPKSPEPSLGVIKFPGGHVEVSRASDDTYWAHISVDEQSYIKGSRIDYTYGENADIPKINNEQRVRKIAVRIDGEYLEPGD